jgi:hypothetical protein
MLLSMLQLNAIARNGERHENRFSKFLQSVAPPRDPLVRKIQKCR